MAYRMFHDTYVNRLLRYLLVSSAGNEDAAREALQRTFLRVVKHIRIFHDEAAFWSWLTVLARSSLFDERRSRRRYLSFLDRFSHDAEPAPRAPVDAADSQAELSAMLARAVAALPTDERELIEWKYTERQPVRAIAERLGVTEKTIESRLVRIRQKLKHATLAALKDEARNR